MPHSAVDPRAATSKSATQRYAAFNYESCRPGGPEGRQFRGFSLVAVSVLSNHQLIRTLTVVFVRQNVLVVVWHG